MKPRSGPGNHVTAAARLALVALVAALLVPGIDATRVQAVAHSRGQTVGAVVEGTKNTISRIEGLLPRLESSAAGVLSAAGDEMRSAVEELKSMVQGDFAQPLTDLDRRAAAMAQGMQIAVQNLNDLLREQRQCFSADMELFLGGIATVVAQLKEGVPLVAPGRPRLVSFQFEGHRRSVVPRTGGRLTLSGHALWNNEPPRIQLVDRSTNTVVGVLKADRGKGAHEISAELPGQLVQAYAGKCLSVQVDTDLAVDAPIVKASGCGCGVQTIPGTKVEKHTLHMPVCMPDPPGKTQYRLLAMTRYRCPAQKEYWGETLTFRAENRNTRRSIGFSDFVHVELPQGCRIVGRKIDNGASYRSEAHVLIRGMKVAVVGTVHDAEGIFGEPKRPSVLERRVTPRIICKSTTAVERSTESSWIRSEDPVTKVCTDLPRACEFDSSEFRFQLLRKLGSNSVAMLVDDPQWYTAPRTGATPTEAHAKENLRILASYNPAPDAVKSQACATVTARKCNY